MTLRISARVRREPFPTLRARYGEYLVSVAAVDDDGIHHRRIGGWSKSWAEAMQLAYKLRADLDRALMDEIHAERTTRRKTKEPEDVHAMEATA